MIPLLHDFEGETVLVFGGGSVGARKARRFGAEARVVVVSPAFADERFAPRPAERRHPDAGTDLVRAAPGPGDVAGWLDRADPALVVAATDDADLNAAIEQVAGECGVLVNRADRAGGREAGSVVVPATVRDDPVVAALSTGGGSPALAKHLRERLEDELDGVGELAAVSADVRGMLRDRGVSPEERREAVRAVVQSSRVWKVLGTGGDKLRQTAEEVASDVIDADTDEE